MAALVNGYVPNPADIATVVGALPVDPDDGTVVVAYPDGAEGTPLWGFPEPVAIRILTALAAAGRLRPAQQRSQS